MATWLAFAGFVVLVGLPLYLMWGRPRRDSEDGIALSEPSAPPPTTDASHTASVGDAGGDP